MSFDTNATGGYFRNNVPPGDASLTTWVNFPTISGPGEILGFWGSGGVVDIFRFQADNTVRGLHTGTGDTATLFTPSTATWYYLLLTYQAETGGGGNGVLTVKYLADGDSAFQATQQLTGLTDNVWSDLIIGVNRPAGGSHEDIIFGPTKFYDAIISDADALTEREYRHNQTGNEFATYKFASGALTTDESANGYTLSAIGTGQAHTASEPTAILGDDPASGVDVALTTISAGATMQALSKETRAALTVISAGASVQGLTPTLGSGVDVPLTAITAGADMGQSLGTLSELPVLAPTASVQAMAATTGTGIVVAFDPVTAGSSVQALTKEPRVALAPFSVGADVQPFLGGSEGAGYYRIAMQRRTYGRSRR